MHNLIGSGVLAIHALLGYMHKMSLHVLNAHIAHCTLPVVTYVLTGIDAMARCCSDAYCLIRAPSPCRFGPGQLQPAVVLYCLSNDSPLRRCRSASSDANRDLTASSICSLHDIDRPDKQGA